MIEFLLDSRVMPFTAALAFMILMGLIEGVGMMIGVSLGSLIDDIIPDLDLGADVDMDVDADIDVDVDADMDGISGHGPSVFLVALSWTGFGKVPLLALLAIYLFVFGSVGIVTQDIVRRVTMGWLLPTLLAVLPVIVVTVPVARWLATVVAKMVPKEDTESVSSKTFVGQIATVTRGTARRGTPAEAKLTDKFGQKHYIMVEPDGDADTFPAGTQVLLVRRAGAVFKAIVNDNPAMVD